MCVYLDLVGVHAGVGDQDVDVLQPLRLVHSDLLVQQETWTKAKKPTCDVTAANQKKTRAGPRGYDITRPHLRPGRSRWGCLPASWWRGWPPGFRSPSASWRRSQPAGRSDLCGESAVWRTASSGRCSAGPPGNGQSRCYGDGRDAEAEMEEEEEEDKEEELQVNILTHNKFQLLPPWEYFFMCSVRSTVKYQSYLWSTAASLRASLATWVAFLQPEMMVCGWIFLAIRSSASCDSNSDG